MGFGDSFLTLRLSSCQPTGNSYFPVSWRDTRRLRDPEPNQGNLENSSCPFHPSYLKTDATLSQGSAGLSGLDALPFVIICLITCIKIKRIYSKSIEIHILCFLNVSFLVVKVKL